MGVRFYPDESAESGASAIVEGIFVKEIARGMRRDMVLQCASIEFLLVLRHSDSKQIAAPAFADEAAQTFEARIFPAEMQIQAHRRGIMIDRRRVHLQRDDVFSPILRAHVSHLRARAGDEIVYAAGEAGSVLIHERKCSITVTFASSSATRSKCGNTDMLSSRSQWKISIGNSISTPARHVKKCSRRNQRLVQRGELGRAKLRSVRHEMFPEQIGVLNHGALERLKNDAALFQLLRNDVALDN